MEDRKLLLEQLDQTMKDLYALYGELQDPDMEVYEDWTAKDILGHITFWHESFARNVHALVEGRKPSPLKGTYAELTRRCMEEMRPLTTGQIIDRLQTAHRIIQEGILCDQVGMIPYKKGSRDYSPEEHLEIVSDHIRKHIRDIQKANQAG